jgi:RNA polymerase sigma-70 factor (ECF subfamily)
VEDKEILKRAIAGDESALNDLFGRHQDRLLRMVRLRINRRIQGRVDEADIVQEACLEASRKIDQYLSQPDAPFYLWLRQLTGLKLAEVHRHHLGVQMRDAGKDVSIFRGALPEANSVSLAANLMGALTSPSQAAIKADQRLMVQTALDALDPLDREILALRHFEQLTNAEAAMVLELTPSGAAARHMRAIKRLKTVLQERSEFTNHSNGTS